MEISQFLRNAGEFFASGFFEEESASPFCRISRGIRRQLENVPLPAYQGECLYPSGINGLWRTKNGILTFHYSYTLAYDRNALVGLIEQVSNSQERNVWERLKEKLDSYPLYSHQLISPEYTVGGRGYTHSIPNYGRVLREGLLSYQSRISALVRKYPAGPWLVDLSSGLMDVLEGIKALWSRICQSLPSDSPVREDFQVVPWQPAKTFRQALLATNLIFYLDGCDSLGRLDQELGPYYDQDFQAGLITEEAATELIRALWKNFDANSGWNVVLGGSDVSGRPAYNRLTLVCLKAARKMRRPNLALRIRRDMPDEYFEEALKTLGTGCGLPALYNEEAYLQALHQSHLNINFRDICQYAFGGCTETMMHGMSNVGSLDGGINLAGIMNNSLKKILPWATSFNQVVSGLKKEISQAIENLCRQVNADQEQKAKWRPQPMRTLLVEDCLDAGREYNAGGARYNWSVINVGGLANVADSLFAIKKLVFDERVVTGKKFLQVMRSNFKKEVALLKEIRQLAKYGNDENEVDYLAKEVAEYVFDDLTQYACWRGGRFLPGCLMFVTYVGAGQSVPATPDGRHKGEPIADSIGPYFGREKKGPTAMLMSVTRFNHQKAPGTLVLNMRLAKSLFSSYSGRKIVKDLVSTYFFLGGMQVQITVVDQMVLKEAMKNPEKFPDLIIRVGGYSEYFCRLDRHLQETISARTEYGKEDS
ncbi:MAG: hypothetical protein NC911_06540 [Candidatus Omnitrophica bacterium]|nr:hypothetical protein [Candidatus Omnitrophota bacterium]